MPEPLADAAVRPSPARRPRRWLAVVLAVGAGLLGGCQSDPMAKNAKPEAPYQLAIFHQFAPNAFQAPQLPGTSGTTTFSDYAGRQYTVLVPPVLTSVGIASVEPVETNGVITAIRLKLGRNGREQWLQACHRHTAGTGQLLLTVDGWVRAKFPLTPLQGDQAELTIAADWSQAEVDGIVYRAPKHFQP